MAGGGGRSAGNYFACNFLSRAPEWPNLELASDPWLANTSGQCHLIWSFSRLVAPELKMVQQTFEITIKLSMVQRVVSMPVL